MYFENKFTERAANSIRLAQEAAVELGHNYVGSEHMLLGLIREGEGIAAKALIFARAGYDPVHGLFHVA